MKKNRSMVIFQPSGRRGFVKNGITLVEASRLLGADIEVLCGDKKKPVKKTTDKKKPSKKTSTKK